MHHFFADGFLQKKWGFGLLFYDTMTFMKKMFSSKIVYLSAKIKTKENWLELNNAQKNFLHLGMIKRVYFPENT